MARRAQPLDAPAVAGVLAALAIPGLVLASAGAVAVAAGWQGGLGASDWAAVRFTLWQAFLSALLSVALAVPVARALARRAFPGRRALVALMGAPFLLPVIVAVFGLLAIFGRGGALNAAPGWLGLPPVSIYGLQGVVLAHVFFNLPLATRLMLEGWADIPAERFRTAAALGMDAAAVNRHLERPMLVAVAPGAFLVIFALCTTSFAVALTLGGGPRATTVELAIYQALRFDFDLSRAALLALVQLAVTGAVAAVALARGDVAGFGSGRGGRPSLRWDAQRPALAAQDTAVLVLAALFLVLPLAAVLARGLAAAAALPAPVWAAALRSLAVAAVSTLVVVGAALLVTRAAVRLGARGRALEVAVLSAIAASPLVIGTGLFVMLHPVIDPQRLALPVTALVNAVLAMPFAIRALLPAWRTVEADWGRLADSLGLVGLARLRVVLLPRLARRLAFVAGLAAALSMGDLGVIALFADHENATLPLQVYRLMGAYRMEDAAGASVLLLALTLGVFVLIDRGGRRDADA